MMFADLERQIVYLIDNTKPTRESLMAITIEVKKILNIKNY